MRKIYCIKQKPGQCCECSLSSYGSDCRNNDLDCPDPPDVPKLEKHIFELELNRGLSMLCCSTETEDAAYWNGYVRGVRKNFHGENYGTGEEHQLWLTLICERNIRRHSIGKGYRDGLAGKSKFHKEVVLCPE